MGCISSKKKVEDFYPNVFQVMNVDEHGNHINAGQLEITDVDLVLYQQGKSPIKWPLTTLRRYGFDAEHFSFESGRRCQTGPGIYAFRCGKAEQLFRLVQTRVQIQNNEEIESSDVTTNFDNIPRRDCMYLERASIRQPNARSRFFFHNDEVNCLNSEGRACGEPLPLQNTTSTPLSLDSVSLIPPISQTSPLSQNFYANESIIAAATQSLEEKNNNKTFDEPFEPLTLNSTFLNVLPKEDLRDSVNNKHNKPEDISGSILDNNHCYVNVPPAQVALPSLNVQTEPSQNFVTLNWEKPNDSLPNYANFEANSSIIQKLQNVSDAAPPIKSINYIVLDLEPTGDSPVTSFSPSDIPQKSTGSYAAIDFKKTAALLISANPNFDTDSESSRKTRHSSNINNLISHNRRSSSVSD